MLDVGIVIMSQLFTVMTTLSAAQMAAEPCWAGDLHCKRSVEGTFIINTNSINGESMVIAQRAAVVHYHAADPLTQENPHNAM